MYISFTKRQILIVVSAGVSAAAICCAIGPGHSGSAPAIAVDSNNLRPTLRIFTVGRTPVERAQWLYDQAYLFYSDGYYERTLELLDRASAIDPDNCDFRLLRAGALYSIHKFDQAIAEVDAVIKVRPQWGIAYCNRAYILQYRASVEGSDRKSVEALLKLSLKDWDMALECPEHWENALLRRSKIKQQLGDADGAAEDLTEYLKKSPRCVEALVERAALLEERDRYSGGDYKRSAIDLTAALKILPHNPWLLYQRGCVYTCRQDYSKALTDIDAAIAIEPIAYRLGYRAQIKMQIKDYAGAVDDLTRCIELGGYRRSYLPERAMAREKMGDHIGAFFDRATATTLRLRYALLGHLRSAFSNLNSLSFRSHT